MNEWVGRWPDRLVSSDAGLDREFEERLRDSSRLAFSIAYSVLRNRADAEEVAQDAFARAFRTFGQLRDRERTDPPGELANLIRSNDGEPTRSPILEGEP